MIAIRNKFFFIAALSLIRLTTFAVPPAKITVDAAHPAHAISPTLWGIFFEDINMSTDGGIYPEMVRNRSFEDADTPENWKFTSVGDGHSEAAISTADVHGQPVPLNCFNRKSLRVKVDGTFTLQNEGYWGMNIVSGEGYNLKLAARVRDGFNSPLTAKLIGADGKILASGEISGFDAGWKYHTLALTPTAGDPKAKLEISGDGKGVLFLDMISLLPDKTWKNHGLRADLAESLDGLHPKFMRFPGGCWVEGDDFAHMNHWKNTIGDIDSRTPLWNIWGYNATHGLGYYEYLQLAEDLGAEPLFCINVGMSHKENVPLDRMDQWAQDALDAIEFANGPTNSIWGARRAAMGHPAAFNLKYMEIGNENGGPAYRERRLLLVNAIRAKYPEMHLITDTYWVGEYYPKDQHPEIIDEHFYDSPEWFMRNANRFDQYDRDGPKVFVGEYAVTRGCGLGDLRGAMGEAAFMTGLERNSDHVIMASYAPLLVNLNHRAWNPDLINFDSANWYGLPSYYVQQMFAENRGDVYLPTEVQSPDAAPPAGGGRIGVGTWNTAAEFKDFQVTAPDGKILLAADFGHGTQGWKLLGDGANWQVQDGVLRQTTEREFIRALVADRKWTDYTITLKARKISGAEGFLILFNVGNDDDHNWWNIGGWGNIQDGIEGGGDTLDVKPSHIETGRWYDLKLTVAGNHVKCWLDGQLLHDVDFGGSKIFKALYATAATDTQTGDVIVKVVNANTLPLATEVDLTGSKLIGKGTATVLTSENPTDENSLANPMKVSPKMEPVNFTGTRLRRAFPGNSFTVLRLQSH